MTTIVNPLTVVALTPQQTNMVVGVLSAVVEGSPDDSTLSSLAEVVTLLKQAGADLEPLSTVDRDLESRRIYMTVKAAQDRDGLIAEHQMRAAIHEQFPRARFLDVSADYEYLGHGDTDLIVNLDDVLDKDGATLMDGAEDADWVNDNPLRESGYLDAWRTWVGIGTGKYRIDLDDWNVSDRADNRP